MAQQAGNGAWRCWCAAAGGVADSLERARQRRALSRLDTRLLRDLGLQRDHVHGELRKWFWQP